MRVHSIACPRVNQIRTWLAFFLLGWLIAFAHGQSPIEDSEGLSIVRWTDAKQVTGKTAIVTGKIVDVGNAGRINFLNFDANRRDVFKIVIFEESLAKFTKPLAALYDDKLVAVRGRVTLFKGVPQIEVTSMKQIRVVDRLPKSRIVERLRRKLSKRVRIATFNVRNLFDDVDNPYFADETTIPKPRAELERLAKTINRIDADVLSLQEVESRGYLQRFNEVFLGDMAYEVVHYSGNDQRGSGLAVLSRIPIGKVVSHRHLQFRDTSGKSRRFSRDLLCVEIQHPFAPAFEIWVTHLKSKRGGPAATEPQRLAETSEIKRILQARLQRAGSRILLMGDFNDTYESKPIQNLLSGSKLVSFTDDLPADSITYNQDPYKAMIDFIFASPAAAEGYVAHSYRVVDQTLAQSGSDHNAVVAEFEF